MPKQAKQLCVLMRSVFFFIEKVPKDWSRPDEIHSCTANFQVHKKM